VRVFRQKFTLEDAIGPHASSLEASRRVTNLGCPRFLPVHTVNCVQTLKVLLNVERTRGSSRGADGGRSSGSAGKVFVFQHDVFTMDSVVLGLVRLSRGWYGARVRT
jgi:hypothetical protein